MNTWTVEVPEQIREQLHQRALSEGKDARTVALEILSRALAAPVEKNRAAGSTRACGKSGAADSARACRTSL